MTIEIETSAPYLKPGDTAVLFDGTCKLCNGWAAFIIQYDQAHRIQLAAVQSPEGQELLKWAGLPLEKFNTIVLISDNNVCIRSEAMFEILGRLNAPVALAKSCSSHTGNDARLDVRQNCPESIPAFRKV